jgi:hypothetical protein
VRPGDAAELDVSPLSAQPSPGMPTLDLCYVRFGSEAGRVARRLYALSQIEGEPTGRNDVVVYADAATAGQALAQARQAVAGCRPGVWMAGTTGEQPEASFRYAVLPAAATPGLAAAALAVTEAASYRDGSVHRTVRIFQRRGRILVVLDGYGTLDAALRLARACARRLAALPAGEVG